MKDHRDHDIVFNHVAATNKRKELMETLKPLREMAACLSLAVDEILITKHMLAAQGQSVEFKTIIERHKQILLNVTTRKICEKMENL